MPVKSHHVRDGMGMPGGGSSHGAGFAISWYAINDWGHEGPQGAHADDVIEAVVDRLRFLVRAAGWNKLFGSDLHYTACNVEAIVHLEAALEALRKPRSEDAGKPEMTGEPDGSP